MKAPGLPGSCRLAGRWQAPAGCRRWALILIALTFSSCCCAVDTQLSGYATLGMACFDEPEAQFAINAQNRGPGRENRCDAGLDSIVAVQLNSQFNETLEAVLQAEASRDVDNQWSPSVRNALLIWRPLERLYARLGRSSNPNFLYSESRDLRYVMPWARPPPEVYGVSPNLQYDGVDVAWRLPGAAANAELQVGLARSRLDGTISGGTAEPVRFTQGFLIASAEWARLRLKLSHVQGRVTFRPNSVEGLLALLRLDSPAAADLADSLVIDDHPFQVSAAGAHWTSKDWSVHAEVSHRPRIGFFRAQRGAYISLGRHWDDWSITATQAVRRSFGPTDAAQAGALQPFVRGLLDATRYDNDSSSLSVVRQLRAGIRLKLQLDWISPRPGSFGPYVNHTNDYPRDRPNAARLIALNLDLVF